MEDEPLMKTSEVARLAGVDRSTVTKWVHAGQLKYEYVTPGGHYRFRRDVVDELLQKQ